MSNLRAAYAEAASAYLVGSGDGTRVTVDKTAKTVTVTGIEFKGTQTGFSGLQAELPFTHTLSDSSTEGGAAGTYSVVFTFEGATDKNNCSLTTLTKTA